MNHDEFDWDEANIRHIERHNVTPDEAEEVIKKFPVEIDYQFVDGEERTELLGMTNNNNRLLTVVITPRSGNIKVVTAFPANPRLRFAYFKAAGFPYDE